jgi:hypothetical protein
MNSHYVEWTVAVPLRDDDLDAAVEAITGGLAALADPDGVHDVDCGVTFTTGAVKFCGYVAADSVDHAYRRFADAVRDVIVDWHAVVERTVHIEAPEPASA